MRTKFIFRTVTVLVLSVVVGVSSCKKKEKDSPVPAVSTGTPTAVGTPSGISNSATIDAAGGTVLSADGRLEIIIPANALSTPTVIGIQPVTNTAFGGAGEAYDLTPNGQQFDQPVTVRFHYDSTDLAGTDFHAFGIACQKDDHIWYLFKSAALDSVAQTESVATTHFTPYALYRRLSVEPTSGDIKVSESLALKVRIVSFVDNPDEEELAMVGLVDYSQPSQIVWSVNGGTLIAIDDGTISPIDNSISTTYTAPSNTGDMSANPVAVTAQVSGVSLAGASKVYLTSSIKVSGKNFNVDVAYAGTSVFMAGSLLVVDYTDYASFHLSFDNTFVADVSLIINNPGHVEATYDANGCSGYATSEGDLFDVTAVDGYYIANQISFDISSNFIQPTFTVNCGSGVTNAPSLTFYPSYNVGIFPDDDQPHTVVQDFGGGEVLTVTLTPE